MSLAYKPKQRWNPRMPKQEKHYIYRNPKATRYGVFSTRLSPTNALEIVDPSEIVCEKDETVRTSILGADPKPEYFSILSKRGHQLSETGDMAYEPIPKSSRWFRELVLAWDNHLECEGVDAKGMLRANELKYDETMSVDETERNSGRRLFQPTVPVARVTPVSLNTAGQQPRQVYKTYVRSQTPQTAPSGNFTSKVVHMSGTLTSSVPSAVPAIACRPKSVTVRPAGGGIHAFVKPYDVPHVGPSIPAALYQQFQQQSQQNAHIGGILQFPSSTCRVRECDDIRCVRSANAAHSNGGVDTRRFLAQQRNLIPSPEISNRSASRVNPFIPNVPTVISSRNGCRLMSKQDALRSTVKRAINEEPKNVYPTLAINVPTCSLACNTYVVDTGHFEPGPSVQHVAQPVMNPRPSILRKSREPGVSASTRRLILADSQSPISSNIEYLSTSAVAEHSKMGLKRVANVENRNMSASSYASSEGRYVTQSRKIASVFPESISLPKNQLEQTMANAAAAAATEQASPRKRMRKQNFEVSQQQDKMKYFVSQHDVTLPILANDGFLPWKSVDLEENVGIASGNVAASERTIRGRRTHVPSVSSSLLTQATDDRRIQNNADNVPRAKRPRKSVCSRATTTGEEMAQVASFLSAPQVLHVDDRSQKHAFGFETSENPEEVARSSSSSCSTHEWQERNISEDEKTSAGAILCKLSERFKADRNKQEDDLHCAGVTAQISQTESSTYNKSSPTKVEESEQVASTAPTVTSRTDNQNSHDSMVKSDASLEQIVLSSGESCTIRGVKPPGSSFLKVYGKPENARNAFAIAQQYKGLCDRVSVQRLLFQKSLTAGRTSSRVHMFEKHKEHSGFFVPFTNRRLSADADEDVESRSFEEGKSMSEKLLSKLPPCAPSTSRALEHMSQNEVYSDMCKLANIEGTLESVSNRAPGSNWKHVQFGENTLNDGQFRRTQEVISVLEGVVSDAVAMVENTSLKGSSDMVHTSLADSEANNADGMLKNNGRTFELKKKRTETSRVRSTQTSGGAICLVDVFSQKLKEERICNSETELAYLKNFVELVRSYDAESYEEFVNELLKDFKPEESFQETLRKDMKAFAISTPYKFVSAVKNFSVDDTSTGRPDLSVLNELCKNVALFNQPSTGMPRKKKSRKNRGKQRCNIARGTAKTAAVQWDIDDLQPAKGYDELVQLLEEDLTKFLPENSDALHFYRTATNRKDVEEEAKSPFRSYEFSAYMAETVDESLMAKAYDWINDVIARKDGGKIATSAVRNTPAKVLLERGHEIREQYSCLLQRVRSAKLILENSVAMLDRCRTYVKSRTDAV